MNINKIKKGNSFKAVMKFKVGNESFTETTTYTVKKITAAGNFKVIDEYGTGCTLKPGFFNNSQVIITDFKAN